MYALLNTKTDKLSCKTDSVDTFEDLILEKFFKLRRRMDGFDAVYYDINVFFSKYKKVIILYSIHPKCK